MIQSQVMQSKTNEGFLFQACEQYLDDPAQDNAHL